MYKILYQELQDYVFDKDCSGIMTRDVFRAKRARSSPPVKLTEIC